MKKRIIIIRSNPVNPDSRVEKEALSLVNNGYSVVILCWDRDSNYKEKEDKIVLNKIEIPVVRIGKKASYGEGLKNLKAFLAFQIGIRRWLKRHRNSFDVVHACDFDTAFSTYKIALRYKKKFVFDIFDFLFYKPKNFLQKIVKNIQIDIINKSSATIICTEERRLEIEGSIPKKLVVIHNSPSKEQLSIQTNNVFLKNDKITICYVGILQEGRLLKEIGHYFSFHTEYEFNIGGFGFLESYFVDLSNKYENIHFYGKLPYEKTLELEMASDIMLAIYDPSRESHRFAAPNKFYESLFLGKPVIMVKQTGMSNVVEENRIGVLIDYSEESFGKGIDLLVKKMDEWSTIREKMKKIYKEKYSWEEMEKRLLQLYDSLF